MTIHLQKFVDRVRGQEARGARDLVMTMAEAKDLHADITRLMITLQTLQEKHNSAVDNDTIVVKMQGGHY
jgi:hypothetical protein